MAMLVLVGLVLAAGFEDARVFLSEQFQCLFTTVYVRKDTGTLSSQFHLTDLRVVVRGFLQHGRNLAHFMPGARKVKDGCDGELEHSRRSAQC